MVNKDVYVQDARKRKVDDAMGVLVKMGVPFTPWQVRGFTENQWDLLARAIRRSGFSETTRAMLVERYRKWYRQSVLKMADR